MARTEVTRCAQLCRLGLRYGGDTSRSTPQQPLGSHRHPGTHGTAGRVTAPGSLQLASPAAWHGETGQDGEGNTQGSSEGLRWRQQHQNSPGFNTNKGRSRLRGGLSNRPQGCQVPTRGRGRKQRPWACLGGKGAFWRSGGGRRSSACPGWAVPALPAGAGSAQGRPQAGMCCAPAPKKATSAGSGSGPGPAGQRRPGTGPAAPAIPAAGARPLRGPRAPVPQGPHAQPALRMSWGSQRPLISTPNPTVGTGIGQGADPTTGDWPGAVTLGLAGTQAAAGGFTRIGQQPDSHPGLVSAWILTWDWSMHGFSHRIAQHTYDWSVHRFSHGIGHYVDSDVGLVRALIHTQDWPAQ